MKVQKMVSQHRRDFQAIYECEHCKHTYQGYGYDDEYFHHVVIPGIKCEKCGKSSGDDYRPQATKYPDGVSV